MNQIKGSISIAFVEEALYAAGQKGSDVPALAVRAGISQELLANPQSRVSPQQYGALWHVLAQALDDEFFGMDSRPMRYGSFAILCHSLLDCRNLGHALSRAIRFFALILDDMTGELQCDGEQATIVLKDGRESPRLFAHGTYFVILHGLACWLTRRRLRISGAQFCQRAPANLPEYRNIFGKHLHFEQARSALSLEAAALNLPILRDGPAATAFLRQAPANILVKYSDCDGKVARIRRLLAATPFEDWPDFARVAAALHTTASTLRRHLDEEGTGYQEIKDALRRDKAIDLLCNSATPIETIAFELGFREISAFYKAFRKWTGVKPGDYRVQAGSAPGRRRYAQF